MRLPLNCLVVALTIWSRASFRSAVGVRRSLGLGGLIPHFFHVHERGRSVVIEDYIPRRRKTAMLDPGDTFVLFDGLYRVRVFQEVGSATSDTLFGAYRQALGMAAGAGCRGGRDSGRAAKSRQRHGHGRARMDKASTGVSYAGGVVSIISALTLNEWGVLFGIATAAATLGINWYYKHREDKRLDEAHRAKIDRLVNDRRRHDVESPNKRRATDGIPTPSMSRSMRAADDDEWGGQ